MRGWPCGNQILAPYATYIHTGIAPDVCTCKDGYGGFDCRTPLCRHLQYPDEQVAACENGGVCKEKDTCECVTALSVLHEKFPNAPGGATGWQGGYRRINQFRGVSSTTAIFRAGTDCTMPICVQGYFAVHKSNSRSASHGLHATDATPARWGVGVVSDRSIQSIRPRCRRNRLTD